MATQEQLDNAEVVIADQDGTNPFGALAYKLSVAAFNQHDPLGLLEDFLQRAENPNDPEVAHPRVIVEFDAPAAYVASRIQY